MTETGIKSAEKRRAGSLNRLGELFDASALGLVTLLLLAASFFATWRGMSDFIASHDLAVGVASRGLVFLIVMTLSLAMYVALREFVAPYYARGWWAAIWKRVLAGALYGVLGLWSIGFGYGFWWSLIAGQSATEAALQKTVSSISQEASDLRARLDAAGSVMASALEISEAKAVLEAEEGGTCGVRSGAGDGPLARARGETQVQIAALAASVETGWKAPLEARLLGLEDSLQTALNEESGSAAGGGAGETSRKARFETLGRQSELAAREIGADATARGRVLAAQLRAKADQLSIPPEGGRVAYCYDRDLAAALYAASDELAQTYIIEPASFEFAEGADGVAHAIETLFERGLGLAGLGVDRAGQGRASLDASFAGRDLIALLATIGVDFALFVFALLRGGRGQTVAAHGPYYKETDLEALEGGPDVLVLREDQQARLPVPDIAPEEGIIEADFAEGVGEDAKAKLRVKTFEPESQEELADRIASLLERVEQTIEAIGAATLAVEQTPLRNMLADTLRELRGLGYLETGASDKVYSERLHDVIEEVESDLPAGHIVRIVRPRFMDADGQIRLRARVIVSRSRKGAPQGD